ncbi:MAG: aminotransferase class I/II-fold pyridoxal phosphate-dependent enzyme [Clostridia bacterium]|nr:aminotransferase class I/II-fold pyridoxal phosphate-dependent enzyme [Clostridia bacterium]
MAKWTELSREELIVLQRATQEEYEECKAKGLKLDMSRGKPGKDQLDLSKEMLSLPGDLDDYLLDGVETRNYGGLDGLPSCKKLFADLLGVQPSEVFVGGNASLNLMFDVISKAYTHGLKDSDTPWAKLDCVKFLCPVPGYDRHFSVSACFGMELIPVPMTAEGPDMDVVEDLIKDPAVKGIWCVPKYSNPEGIIYSDAVVERIASMKPAAKDFIIMWDNAYCVHEIEGEFVPFKDILTECRKAGNPDMVYEFASTSKVTFPGAGVAVFATSEANMAYMKKIWGMQTIGYDKINQLRHIQFLKDRDGVLALMKKHAAILKPKFDAVLEKLDSDIAPLGIASWHRPKGGYFVSLDTLPGCAKRTHALCKEAGVVLTGAGATWPGGKDPKDSNLRIAPSFPSVDELKQAISVFCICLKLAALEKLLAE